VPPSVPRALSRTARRRRAEADERRRTLPKMFGFFLVGWLLFGLLDPYIAFVVSPATPLGWLSGLRALGVIAPLVGWLTTRRGRVSERTATALELATFLGSSACLSLMALAYGGLDSHYVHGISLVLAVQTMASPARWQRALPMALATFAVYPLAMGAAAILDPTVAEQWRGHDAIVFAQDYSLVLAFAVGGTVGGHLVWAMRRQLYYARRLGRYRLKVRIGSGGMSEVWLAWDDALRRDVALKILDRKVASDAHAIARFEREAQAASGLQSPHTIRVFDFGASDDGVWFIAMEHLEGVDLATLVEEGGRLPVARAIGFIRQACASLAEAHDAGIVHRDVKPENLFVSRTGDEVDFLKVLDFGIARIDDAEEDATVTRSGWVHGTPAYMPPEVCNGERADARSDVYSLGAVLYYLLTAAPPFAAPTAAAVMVAHVSEAPSPPSSRAPVPEDVERVVMRCLSKDPSARFESARELDQSLAECKDARAWTSVEARAFWTTFPVRPRAATRPRADAEVDEHAATQQRPSIPGGVKVV
jgi:hypothetical protein